MKLYDIRELEGQQIRMSFYCSPYNARQLSCPGSFIQKQNTRSKSVDTPDIEQVETPKEHSNFVTAENWNNVFILFCLT
jgi:hypothetical protein